MILETALFVITAKKITEKVVNMILFESIGNNINNIVAYCKEQFDNGNYKFSGSEDGIKYWCDDDSDKTVFITDGDDSYATIDKSDFDNYDTDDIVNGIKAQLDGTYEDNTNS